MFAVADVTGGADGGGGAVAVGGDAGDAVGSSVDVGGGVVAAGGGVVAAAGGAVAAGGGAVATGGGAVAAGGGTVAAGGGVAAAGGGVAAAGGGVAAGFSSGLETCVLYGSKALPVMRGNSCEITLVISSPSCAESILMVVSCPALAWCASTSAVPSLVQNFCLSFA